MRVYKVFKCFSIPLLSIWTGKWIYWVYFSGKFVRLYEDNSYIVHTCSEYDSAIE